MMTLTALCGDKVIGVWFFNDQSEADLCREEANRKELRITKWLLTDGCTTLTYMGNSL